MYIYSKNAIYIINPTGVHKEHHLGVHKEHLPGVRKEHNLRVRLKDDLPELTDWRQSATIATIFFANTQKIFFASTDIK